MSRAVIARVLDAAILVVTLLYGLLFMLVQVFARDSAETFARIDGIVTVVLVTALAAQLALATDRRRWLAQNWIDVVVVVFVVFPVLRILRVVRYAPLGYAMPLARLAVVMGAGLRAHLRSYGPGHFYNIFVAAVVVVLLSAALVEFVEDGAQEANIKSLGDTVWWAMATVTTVGYGDKYPTTVPGRIIASVLMLLGIALFGVLTASLSSMFLAQSREPEVARLRGELETLRAEIAALRQDLRRSAREPSAGSESGGS